LVAEVAELT
jgi:hypothetical protein